MDPKLVKIFGSALIGAALAMALTSISLLVGIAGIIFLAGIAGAIAGVFLHWLDQGLQEQTADSGELTRVSRELAQLKKDFNSLMASIDADL